MSAEQYLSGPSVCGFHGLFDADYGAPSKLPMPRVTPSKLGTALLPFHCPSCDASIDFSDSKTREDHHDTRVVDGKKRDNYYCPSCGTRFLLNMRGAPLTTQRVLGAVAPSTIERITVGGDGMIDVKRTHRKGMTHHLQHYITGTDILGSC